MTAYAAGTSRGPQVRGVVSEIVANHLVLAAYLSAWAEDLTEHSGRRECPNDEADFILGYQRALRDLAGHLRAGDALPGGPVDAVA